MNAYDFDKTIYDGDSGTDLIKYTFRKLFYQYITCNYALASSAFSASSSSATQDMTTPC